MKRNVLKLLLAFSLSFCVLLGLTACENTPTYSVTFVGGENTTGMVAAISDLEENTQITLPENAFVKEGYAFKGWNDGENSYLEGDTYTVPAKNVTFTAVWAELFDVTFALGEFASTAETTPAPVTDKEGGYTFSLPATPATIDAHHDFVGWNDGTTTYPAEAEYTVTKDVTFTGVWSTKEYRVSFNLNGSAGTPPSATDYAYNTQIDLPGQGNMINSGYTFLGWATTSNATEVIVGKYTVTGPVTLYAIWKQSYDVTFSLGDHAAQSATVPSSHLGQNLNAKITLPEAPAAQNGYYFAGWFDGIYSHNPGESYTITGNVNFIAYWVESDIGVFTYTRAGDSLSIATSYGAGIKPQLRYIHMVEVDFTDGITLKVEADGVVYTAHSVQLKRSSIQAADIYIEAKIAGPSDNRWDVCFSIAIWSNRTKMRLYQCDRNFTVDNGTYGDLTPAVTE